MTHVFRVSYFYEKHHEINEHIFNSFKKACMVVAEAWFHEPDKIFTIVDNRDLEG